MESEVSESGCELVVDDRQRRGMLRLMVEYFEVVGATEIAARLPGYTPPEIMPGTLENHRPDLICRQSDKGHTMIILEVVTEILVKDPKSKNRWSLLSSASKLYQAELHFVVPALIDGRAGDAELKRRLT